MQCVPTLPPAGARKNRTFAESCGKLEADLDQVRPERPTARSPPEPWQPYRQQSRQLALVFQRTPLFHSPFPLTEGVGAEVCRMRQPHSPILRRLHKLGNGAGAARAASSRSPAARRPSPVEKGSVAQATARSGRGFLRGSRGSAGLPRPAVAAGQGLPLPFHALRAFRGSRLL